MGLVWTSRFSFGQTDKGDGSPDKAGADKAKDEMKAGKGAGKAGKGAVLTVIVTGDGKPVAQAEVKVMFNGGGEVTLLTNQSGEAPFNFAGTGGSTVRVIATGWKSALQEVVLKPGPQQLAIKLKPLSKAP